MSQQSFVKDLINPQENFDQWYVDVVRKADLADDAPVRGCKVVKPYGYALWENIQSRLDSRFKATGVENAYFPMLIPKSMLEREADHIEGFTPEVAWVTHAGGKELEEPLAIRPTSESIICPIFAGWVQSWRDLPIVVNQWASVLRWEERPRAFLRTSEFLWQEGHTVHATLEEANDRARQMLDVYQDFLETELAIPVIPGVKSESEKFAGAYKTYTAEAMMGGRFWALQACTSHNLSNHFGKVYDILFLDKDGTRKHAYSTSWGLSHRVIGATVMVHGDESGIKMPPRVAPIQAVIIPILGRGDGADVLAAARNLRDSLVPDVRIKIDERDDRSPGYKFSDWEVKGVPIRIELGPRDLAAEQVVLALRDTREKITVPLAGLKDVLIEQLAAMQIRLYNAAAKTMAEHTADVDTYAELEERVAANAGWNRVGWCGSENCETRIKTETKATIRCIPFDQPDSVGSCVVCGNPATSQAIVARAY